MAADPLSTIETRRHQMFPVLEGTEIDRLRRFGDVRRFSPGAPLAKVGEVGQGLLIVLTGKVQVTQRNRTGPATHIVTHGPGGFLGELAQLAGRPALVDAETREPVEALVIPPERLRAVFVAEAEVGERIMRALILETIRSASLSASNPPRRHGVTGRHAPPARRSAPAHRRGTARTPTGSADGRRSPAAARSGWGSRLRSGGAGARSCRDRAARPSAGAYRDGGATRTARPTGASSTMRPRYMTPMRVAMCRTTARLWLMKR